MTLALVIPVFWEIPMAASCEAVVRELKLPARVRTEGRPARARWGEVARVMTDLRERLEGRDCRLTFGEVFQARREDQFFPLTYNLIRTVPEDALNGIAVFSSDGELLGEFSNRVVFEKTGGLEFLESYTLYYFQFLDQNGVLQSTGTRRLEDEFLVKWQDLREKIAISTSDRR